MKYKEYEQALNKALESLKSIDSNLVKNGYPSYLSTVRTIQISTIDDDKSFNNLGMVVNYVIENLNYMLKHLYALGFVDMTTGEGIKSVGLFKQTSTKVDEVNQNLNKKMNEITNALNQLLKDYGFLDGPLTPKEDFDVLPKSSWNVVTGRTSNGSRYWRTEIKNAKMGVGFAHDIATGGISEYETAQEFAKRHNLPVVSNASRFSYNASGAVATKGKPQAKRMHKGKVFARNWNDAYTQYLTIESDGKTLGTKPNGVDFKNGDFEEVLLAFYPLFEDGEPSARPVVDDKYESGLSEQPRQILYQLQDNTFGILTISARVDGDKGASYEQMIEELQKIGNVKFAYNLDGGGSASNVVEGEMLNPTFDPRSPDGRPVQDFIYFYSDQIEDPITSTVIPLDD